MNWYPTIIAALIIAGGAFFAARQGGKMAAKASRESVRETLEGQEQRDKKRQGEIIEGVLYAIYEELNGIYEQLNSPEVKSAWEKYENPGKKLFDFPYPVPLDYLIIYRANANLIGEINEPPELRRKIVSTYMLLQTLMEKYRTNNALLAQYKETKNRGEPDSNNVELYMQFAEASKTLQEGHKSFKTSTEELFDMLRKKLPQLRNQDSANNST